jgi:protein SCO1/2
MDTDKHGWGQMVDNGEKSSLCFLSLSSLFIRVHPWLKVLARIVPFKTLLSLFVAAALFTLGTTGCVSVKKPPCCRTAEPTGAYTDKSLYQLDSKWTSDVSKEIKLGVFKGQPQVLAMFFTSCEYACPVIVHDMKRLQDALSPALRHQVNFTLVSFDTERDTPAALQAYRQRQKLGTDHWSLLTGQPDDVRELAALLGVNYQKDARGQFAHSNVIIVLNSAGEIVHQQAGLNQDILATVQAIERANQ